MAENKREDLLSSWKEIAAYLDCDERTCLRWEKLHGLPIRRLNGGSKSRVYAFREDLDAWLAERSKPGGAPRNGAVDGPRQRRRHGRFVRIALLAASLLVAALAWLLIPRQGPPADFRIEGSLLTILDAAGHVLWRHDTGAADLCDDELYRNRFQFRRTKDEDPSRLLPWLALRDIDADGSVEVLFAPMTLNETGGGILRCFGSDGQERWTFRTGRTVTFGDRTFPPDFALKGFLLFDVEGDGRSEILVLAHALHEYPAQAAVLDIEGRLRAEYWNSGQWDDAEFADVDDDGRNEILLVGQNNEYRKGALALIDAEMGPGASPQSSPRYTCREIRAGGEMAYLLFPLSDLDHVFSPGINISTIDALRDGTFRMTTYPTDIEFRLGRNLESLAPSLSHRYEKMYREKLNEGRLTAPFDAARIEGGLREGILYWDGTAWTPEPVVRTSRRPG